MTREQWDDLFLKVDTMPLDEFEKIIVDSARKAGVLQTNYDLLISKTPEELAEWTCQTQFREGDFCPPEHGWQYCQTADGCRECWLGWLKAPVEEVDNG